MPCYHPLEALQRRAGAPLFFGDSYQLGDRRVYVPCGKCIGCRLEFARQWAVRCMHESQLHEQNCFLTLTYDPAHLPTDLSVHHRDFQLFMKRLRKALPNKVRFFMCGEYGDLQGRPHYHAAIFGFYPVDRVFFKTADSGSKCYTSKFLDSVWQVGAVYVGDLTFESAAYIARYVVKKVGSDGVKREIFDVSTGEIFLRSHEYGKMSLKPGIGAEWLTRYACDVYPHDRVVINGAKGRVPRYYDKILDSLSPLYLAELKADRVHRADLAYKRLQEQNPDASIFEDLRRLDVHEEVKLASIRSLHRS